MPYLFPLTIQKKTSRKGLSRGEIATLIYHDIFDYPLSLSELIRWRCGKEFVEVTNTTAITSESGFYHLEGREGLTLKRLMRKRISARKFEIAKRVAKPMKFIPGIKMIAITGALAMENASDDSDIDFMLITKKGSLWTTRLLTLVVLKLFGVSVRRFNEKYEKDKLCLNVWMDEGDLTFRKRNIYTAHELAQIIPLVNKDQTYQNFIWKNRWIKDFWPNSVKVKKVGKEIKSEGVLAIIIEKIAFFLEYEYMKRKITKEKVTSTRALFHPVDWGELVLKRLAS